MARALVGVAPQTQGILFGQRGKGILRVSAYGGVPAAVASDEIADAPQMLPGGKALLFSMKKVNETWEKGQVVAQALGGGGRKTVINGDVDASYVPTGHLVYAVSACCLRFPSTWTRSR